MMVLTEADFEQVLGSKWTQRVRELSRSPGDAPLGSHIAARENEVLRALPSVLYRRVKDMAPWGMKVHELTITATFGGRPFDVALKGELTFKLVADEGRVDALARKADDTRASI